MYQRWELEELKKCVSWEVLLRNLGFQNIDPVRRRCCCIIHNGKNKNSFVWYPERFKCYSCNCTGDKIDLVKIITENNFKESVQFLCDLSGYRINEDSGFKKVSIYEREIPDYFEKKHSNPNYEEIEFRNRFERVKERQVKLINRMHQMICNGEGDSDKYLLVEQLANLNDSEYSYWKYKLKQVSKN